MLPRRVAHYELRSYIGRGGMGIVYKARDLALDRDVALKCPIEALQKDPKARLRFQREARAASRLQHANIITIFEVFESEGVDWLAMEYLEGQSLGHYLKERGPLASKEVLHHAEGLTDALREAHHHRVIHRDIKPSNILLDHKGRARLTDFGLARFQEAPEIETEDSTQSFPITEVGRVVGTTAYMSPEQALGLEVDHRTDIFSLGAVLYEMCTAEPAFAEKSRAQMLEAILHRQPRSIAVLNSTVSDELIRIVGKSLAKRADERYQTADELLVDLRAERRRLQSSDYAESHPQQTAAAKVPSVSFLIVFGVAALALAVGTLYFLLEPRDPRVPEATPRQVTALPGWEADAAISPGGGLIAYASDESGNADIWLIDAKGGKSLRLTDHPGSDRSPAWFPDGSAIAFSSDRGEDRSIWRVPRLGGSPTMLVPRATDPAISPDGARIAFAQRGPKGLYRIAVAELADVTNTMVLTGDDDGFWNHQDPAWSPDGRRLCYSDHWNLWLVSLHEARARQLTSDLAFDFEPVWSSDGRFLYFSSHREGTTALWRVAAKGGEPQRITVGTGPERHPTISLNGAVLAYTTFVDDQDVVIHHLESGERSRLFGMRAVQNPALLPDGSAVVYVSDRWGGFPLWRHDLQGVAMSGEPARLNEGSAASSNPAVSPDGKWVVYQYWSGDERNLRVIPSSGGEPIPLTDSPFTEWHPSWSPDGTRIAYGLNLVEGSEIRIVPMANGHFAGQEHRLETGVQILFSPSWSPDGREIAFAGSDGDTWEIWVIASDGHESPRLITAGAEARRVRWNHARGTLLVSGRWGDTVAALREVDPETGRVELLDPPVSFGPLARDGEFDLSADGRLVAFTWEEVGGDVWFMRGVKGTF